MKVFLTGPSGTGKSTLAQWIAKEYQIPYISTSSKPIWDKHGIRDHKSILLRTALDPQWGANFQLELLKLREQVIIDNPNFVSDRCQIDNIVYYLLQVTPYVTTKETEEYIETARQVFGLMMDDKYIHLSYQQNMIPLENDGKRIVNEFHQIITQELFDMVTMELCADELDGRITEILSWDLELKYKSVKKFLNEK